MKRLLSAVLAALLVTGVALAAAGKVTVIVRKTSIRADRQFYAATLTEAQLGETFDVLAREKGWVKVGTKSGTGWLHESAVTVKKIAAGSQGPSGGAVDDRDIANAGKGFNPQVESEYRKKNPEANYPAVDRMEQIDVGEQDVEAFATSGQLRPRGGDR